jgi:hypothetical protein
MPVLRYRFPSPRRRADLFSQRASWTDSKRSVPTGSSSSLTRRNLRCSCRRPTKRTSLTTMSTVRHLVQMLAVLCRKLLPCHSAPVPCHTQELYRRCRRRRPSQITSPSPYNDLVQTRTTFAPRRRHLRQGQTSMFPLLVPMTAS